MLYNECQAITTEFKGSYLIWLSHVQPSHKEEGCGDNC